MSETSESPRQYTQADLPLQGQVLQAVANLDVYDATSGRADTKDPNEANVITSMRYFGDHPEGQPYGECKMSGLVPARFLHHKVVLDIDHPAQLIPSSTPGHYHLIVDVEVDWHHYATMLIAMGAAGVLEPGYVGASLDRMHTAVRLPWIKKPVTP